MRVLILVNGAQEHRTFYSKVGEELVARGIDVQYAVDSHYTDYVHPDASLGGRSHYFSDYFKAHYGRTDLPKELIGANLWTAFFPDTDRMMYTRFMRRRDPEYYASVISNLAHFFFDLFEQYSFDAFVYENVSNAFSYTAFEVATRRGARFIGFAQSRMPGRTDVYDRAPARDSRLETIFRQICDGELELDGVVEDYVENYLGNLDDKKPDYVVKPNTFELSLLRRYAQRKPIERFRRSWEYGFLEREDLFYAFQVPDPIPTFPEQIVREVWRQTKAALLRRSLYRSDVDLASPYFAYPLQFHPESATSVDGPAFNDEWQNIQQTARNLPVGVRLYVKDHKHAAGQQALGFYEKIARIPNVVLVSPDFDTAKLLRHADAVVVATSTMGFEALLRRKPVFVLGHPFYDFVPGCVRIKSFDGAFEQFAKYESIAVRIEDIRALLAAYFMTSEEGYLDVTKQYDDPKIVCWISDVIQRRTEEHVALREKRVEEYALAEAH